MVTLQDDLNRLPDAHDAILCHAARWVAERFATEQARPRPDGFQRPAHPPRRGPPGPQRRRAWPSDHPAPVSGGPDRRVPGHRRGAVPHLRRHLSGGEPTTRPPPWSSSATPSRPSTPSAGPTSTPTWGAPAPAHGRLYTLRRNYRSTQAMVRAANRCFQARRGAGRGPGRLPVPPGRGMAPTRSPSCPAAARAQGQPPGRWPVPLPALNLVAARPGGRQGYTKGAYLRGHGRVCASEMVRLLKLGQEGAAGFGTGVDHPPAPAPADLAVLVNKRSEAERPSARPWPVAGCAASICRRRIRSSSAPRRWTCSAGWPPAPSPTTAVPCAPPWPPRPSA
jgi:exodeoxyribonuclease V beta subunit